MSNIIHNSGSEKRKEMINHFLAQPFKLGETIKIPESEFSQFCKKTRFEIREILEFSDDGKKARVAGKYSLNDGDVWVNLCECQKYIRTVGANPFAEKDWHSICQSYNFALESIVYRAIKENESYNCNGTECMIPNLNWNPYIIDKDGNKQFYQRDFVWSLEDKQKLIESIYNYIECGKIVVRRHSFKDVIKNWTEGDKSMCFFDIVDGKQRLNAIIGFINNEYPDKHGNYFTDLSEQSQDEFLNHQLLSYAELGEGASDDDTIRTFLMINHTGVEMSEEHINFVKEIYKKI